MKKSLIKSIAVIFTVGVAFTTSSALAAKDFDNSYLDFKAYGCQKKCTLQINSIKLKEYINGNIAFTQAMPTNFSTDSDFNSNKAFGLHTNDGNLPTGTMTIEYNALLPSVSDKPIIDSVEIPITNGMLPKLGAFKSTWNEDGSASCTVEIMKNEDTNRDMIGLFCAKRGEARK